MKTKTNKIIALMIITLFIISNFALAARESLPAYNNEDSSRQNTETPRDIPQETKNIPPEKQQYKEIPDFFQYKKIFEPAQKRSFLEGDSSDIPTSFLERQTGDNKKGLEVQQQAATDLFTGSAGYNYPIEVPQGINNLKPTLFLSYNHHSTVGAPGLFGNGWDVSKNQIIRNTEHTRSDTSDDTFILQLNGMTSELVYVTSEDRYHTKVESNLYIKKISGGDNYKKEHWIVKTKDGTTYRFGYKQDSELKSYLESYISRWSLDQITDVSGNEIKYSYTENPSPDKGIAYPNEITYGDNKIKFYYNTNLLPKRISYANGDQIIQTKIINKVEVKNNNKLVRKYEFGYMNIDNVVSLSSIKAFGSDGNSQLPETTFEYYPLERGWQESNTWKIPSEAYFGDEEDQGVRLLDINGDGLSDIIKMKNSATLQYWLNNGNGFGSKKTKTNFITGGFVDAEGKDQGVRFADINSDARIDMIQIATGELNKKAMKTNTGSSWSSGLSNLPNEVVFVEKETITEIVKQTDYYKPCVPSCGSQCVDSGSYGCNQNDKYCYIDCFTIKCRDNYDNHIVINKVCKKSSCPSGTYPDYNEDMETCNFKFDYSDKVYEDITYFKDRGYRLLDVNGDGKTDIVKAQAGSSNKKTWINTGSNWVVDNDWKMYSNLGMVTDKGNDMGIRFADVNGDGSIDIIKAINNFRQTWLNNGKGWTEISYLDIPGDSVFLKDNKKNGVILVDINGDNLPDILKSKGSTQKAWINIDSGWEVDSDWDVPDDVTLINFSTTVTDINGDGYPDLVKAKSALSNDRKTWLNKGAKTYLLKKVNENAGGTVTFDYQKITDLDNTGSDSIADLPFSGWVVSEVTYDNGMSGTQHNEFTNTYDYENGYYDAEEREFRGFANVEEKNAEGTKTVHNFYQDEAKKGREYKTEVLSSSNKIFKKIENTWDSDKKNGYFIITLDKTKEYTYDGSSSNPKIKEVKFTYDNYGNPTKTEYKGDTGTLSDDKSIHYEYIYNTNDWIVNKAKKQTLKNNINSKIKETKYYYDNQNYGKISNKGKLTKIEEWISGTKYKKTNFIYNSQGNLISETDNNNHKTSYVYESTNTYPTKITNALGQSVEYEYDLGTGNVLSETDSNGYTTSYVYDVLGRKNKIIQPYDSVTKPTVTYEYSFDGDAPEKVVEKYREISGQSGTYDVYSFYDGFGKLIQSKSEAESNKQIVINSYYDKLNRIKEERDPYLSTSSTSYTNPQSVTKTTYTYDPLSRITKIKNQDGSELKFTYDHWKVYSYDENNNRKDYLLDADNNIITIKEYNGNQVYGTDYKYSANGLLTEITDDDNNDFEFDHDGLGRLTNLDDPDLGDWTYTYDGLGNLLQQNSNGNIVTMQYDSLNRLTKKTSAGKTTNFYYDQGTIGTLSKVQNSDLVTEYQYDQRLRTINEKKIIDGITFETDYSYDAIDRVNTIELPGEDITYTYNTQNKLEKINLLGDVIKNINYNENNQVTGRTYKNNLNSVFTYNTYNHRLSEIKTSNKQELDYSYDSVGNVKSINDQKNNFKLAMTYDDLDRLKSVKKTLSNPFTVNYDYDSIGNMLSVNLNGEKITFNYGNKPVHSPKSVSAPISILGEGCAYDNPSCNNNEECVNNVCELKKGCQYNNPKCSNNQNCVNNVCIPKEEICEEKPISAPFCENYNLNAVFKNYLKSDCTEKIEIFQNCASNKECKDGACKLKTGCDYNNPSCKSNENCIKNVCIPIETGCNPPCNNNEYCNNNQCKLKTGCNYDNPSCSNNELCINNHCELKTGCEYNNPACANDEKCVNNACIPKENPCDCGSNEVCKNNICIKNKPDFFLEYFTYNGKENLNGEIKAKINVIVKNLGPKKSSSELEIIKKSTGETISKTTINNLYSSQQKQYKLEIPYPCDTITAVIDKDNKVSEINENNNKKELTLIDDSSCKEDKCEEKELGFACVGNDIYQIFKNKDCSNSKEFVKSCGRSECVDGVCENSYLPDLFVPTPVYSVLITNSPYQGKCEFTFEFFIRNIGKETAKDVSWEIKDENGVILSNSGNYPIAEIKPGYEHVVYPTFIYPKWGLFTFKADPKNIVIESDENNNVGAFFKEVSCANNRR
ncbi:MAG: hypothetical protein HN374_05540 [Cryomorphaceae bacterium]|jgi:YD repeat-containing protein|nr:hypothetical protein [Cryomorphaceae bacterium]